MNHTNEGKKSHKHHEHMNHHKNHGTERHEAKMHHGHEEHHRMMIKDFQKRFWISTALSIPVLILSPMIQNFLGIEIHFPGSHMLLFFLSSVIYFYGGWPFLKGLKDEVKSGNPGMMTLIGIAISVAYLYSSAVVFGLEGKMFFWELVTLIDVMLLGHWIEMKSILGASRALELLVSMLPSEAHLIRGEETVDVPLDQLHPDDLILIKPGEKIPADGIIIEGESFVNEAMLTGESRPVLKRKGDEVIGGAINGNGILKVRVRHTGEESYLNKVISLVREAQESKSKTQNLADKAARWLTFIALGVGFGTLAAWLLAGYDFVFALERMVTVMVISCPHALGLAIPLVVAISTAISAQNGLLIRNRTAFESARKITAIVFDKTGTLTKGVFGVTRFHSFNPALTDGDLLSLAAALEQYSEHPIATGIVDKTKEEGLVIKEAANFQAITGKGIRGTVDGHEVMILSPGALKEMGIDIPKEAAGNEAETVVFILFDGHLAGYIALADEIRPESYDAVKAFKQEGIKVLMATGDNEKVARAVSRELGLDGYYAGILPHEKVEVVKRLQAQGEFVAMTGDGVNDAPALAQADVGIAVGSGTDVAAETADIILVKSNPMDILRLILFGKATYRKMIQNLVWATAYNLIAIPLAAGVLYNQGIVVGPAVGAVFMSLSTVIVAINAQLLRKEMTK